MEGHAGELQRFLRHFTDRMRADVISQYVPAKEGEKKGRYKPRKSPLTEEDLVSHLLSTPAIGLYVLDPQAPDTCRAAVVDLDDHEGKLQWADLWQAALIITQRLAPHGLVPWACRSGGGNGIHLWFLWTEPQPADAVRKLLKEASKDSICHVDIFPAQGKLEGGSVGSLVALPLGRKSRCLDTASGSPIEDLLKNPTTSPPMSAPVRHGVEAREQKTKAKGYGPADPELLLEALSHVNPDQDYSTWQRVGSALQAAERSGQLAEGVGLRIWDQWSSTGAKYNAQEIPGKWRSLRADGSLTLGTVWHLAEEAGWRPAKEKAARDYDTDEAEQLNERHFLCKEGGRVYIFEEEYDEALRRHLLTKTSASDFKLMYLNQQLVVGHSKKGVPVTEDLGSAWLRSPRRRQYKKIVLRPEGAPDDCYNLWRGWACEPSEEGDCSLLKAHMLTNLCRGDQQAYEYLLSWCAQTVQRPHEPIGVAVVMRGGRGVGKGTFARALGDLFRQHFLQIFSGRSITGQFNDHLRDCIVLFADEAVWAGSKQEQAILQGIITEPELSVEGKGKDLVQVRNMLHMIIATNNEWSVPAGIDERRFLALWAGEEKKQDKSYFTAIRDQLKNGGQQRWLWELLNRDLTEFDVFAVPQTEELARQKLLSLDPWAEWWYEKLQTGSLLGPQGTWEEAVPFKALYLDYAQHCRVAGVKAVRSAEHLSGCLRGLLPCDPKVSPQRIKHDMITPLETIKAGTVLKFWELASLTLCRNYFSKKMRKEISWQAVEALTVTKKSQFEDDKPLI